MSDETEQAEGEAPRGDISDKQIKFINVLRDKVGLSDPDMADLLQDVAGKDAVEALDRREASEVIDELQIRAREAGIDLDAQPLASDKQVGFMRSLKRRAHLTDDEFAKFLEERAGVSDPAEVGKRDASTIIDELLALADGKGGGGGGGGARGGGARKKKAAAAAPPPPPPPPIDDDDVPF